MQDIVYRILMSKRPFATFSTFYRQDRFVSFLAGATRNLVNTPDDFRYEFVNTTAELRIPNVSGEISSNDTLVHEWEFCPTTTGRHDFDVNCVLTMLKDKVAVGTSVCIAIRVTGACEVGFLEVT